MTRVLAPVAGCGAAGVRRQYTVPACNEFESPPFVMHDPPGIEEVMRADRLVNQWMGTLLNGVDHVAMLREYRYGEGEDHD